MLQRTYFGTFLLASLATSSVAKERSWTPQVSASVRYFSTQMEDPQVWPMEEGGTSGPYFYPSPDGRFAFFLTHAGLPESDSRVYRLNVYDRARLEAGLRSGAFAKGAYVAPDRLLERRDAPHPIGSEFSSIHGAISDARWSGDSRSIYFIGDDPTGKRQIFRFEMVSGAVRQLTNAQRTPLEFDAVGDKVIYRAQRRSAKPPISYPFELARKRSDGFIAEPTSPVQMIHTLVSAKRERELDVRLVDLRFCPTGHFAAGLRLQRSENSARHSISYVVIAAANGSLRELAKTAKVTDQTAAYAIAYRWSEDCKKLALLNVLHPSAGSPSQAASMVVIEDLSSGRRTFVEPLLREGRAPLSVQWANGKLEIDRGDRADDGRSGGSSGLRPKRSMASPSASGRDSLTLSVRQSPNMPPMAVAALGTSEVFLTRPDPALTGVRLARTERFEWAEGAGRSEGLLTLPPDYQAGEGIPVVIQCGSVFPGLFLPNGSFSPTFGVQSLAARGIAVLQIDTRLIGLPPEEGPRYVARVDAAIDALIARGIADPARIGLNGFSRTGYQAIWLATHKHRHRIAALVAADAYSGAYPIYLLHGRRPELPAGFQRGEKTFWEDKSWWYHYETSFNYDRIDMPVLFTSHVGYDDDLLIKSGALALNRKRFEFAVFPMADHIIRRTRQQMAAEALTTDWFAYWLNNERDADPGKLAQYGRWDALRAMSPAD